MAIEFKETSNMDDIDKLIHEVNGSYEWRGILGVMGSIHRVGRLRGRIIERRDIPDVLFDMRSFVEEEVTEGFLHDIFKKIVFLETIYYSLAGNFAIRAASLTDRERLPDIVDLAKNIVSLTVWRWWRPEKGEDFLDLNRKIIFNLKNLILPNWAVTLNRDTPFSYLSPFQIEKGSFIDYDGHNVKDKVPIFRLRKAVGHLSLPSIIASLERCNPLELLATFSVMGYYPGVYTLTQLCSRLEISRPTVSTAFDRAVEMVSSCSWNERVPSSSVRSIFNSAFERKIIKFTSGRTLRWNDPRIGLVAAGEIPEALNPKQRKILELALIRTEDGFKYEPEEISRIVGCTKSYVHRVIKKVTLDRRV